MNKILSIIVALCTLLVIYSFVFYSFYLRNRRKERYTGGWRIIAERTQTPLRAFLIMLGTFIGAAIAIIIFSPD